jgi:hypothetical protein
MKRQSLLAITLLMSSSIAAFGSLPSEEKRQSRLQNLRTHEIKQKHLNQFERAYLDAISLLEGGNTCSKFFGGVATAQVLDDFAVTIQNRLIRDARMGLVMSGPFTNISNSQTGISYRLFANAQINTIGPFYRAKVRPEDPLIPKVGSFLPNTREARVLILLHELAHLIKGNDGTWLIHDDGGNSELSKQNTQRVESQCGREIRALN